MASVAETPQQRLHGGGGTQSSTRTGAPPAPCIPSSVHPQLRAPHTRAPFALCTPCAPSLHPCASPVCAPIAVLRTLCAPPAPPLSRSGCSYRIIESIIESLNHRINPGIAEVEPPPDHPVPPSALHQRFPLSQTPQHSIPLLTEHHWGG